MKKPIDLELARLDVEYKQRAANKDYAERYSYFNETTLLHLHNLERSLLGLLKKHRATSLREAKILDVGCGSGGYLRDFLHYGALPANLAGIDLMDARIAQAKLLHPGIDWRVGSAHKLPYTDATFDLVMSFVVFSSILDPSLRQQIADEMWRVLRPGGLLLLYDFMYSNPRNAAVQGMSLRHIQRLFARPGVHFDIHRITLAPPLARLIVPHAYWLAYTLQQLKIFNTHTLVLMSRDD